MPLITGMPNFAGAGKVLAADLNTAFTKIVQVLGGSIGGTIYPGDLDANNVPASGSDVLMQDQLAEAFAVLPITCLVWRPSQGDGVEPLADYPVGPLQLDAEIVGLTLSVSGQGVPVPSSLSTEIVGPGGDVYDSHSYDDAVGLREPTVHRSLSIPVPARTVLFVRAAVVASPLPDAVNCIVWVRAPIAILFGSYE